VAAEKIENIYAKAELVQQVFVYGDSFQVRSHCPTRRLCGGSSMAVH
jgi:hypothetical protein